MKLFYTILVLCLVLSNQVLFAQEASAMIDTVSVSDSTTQALEITETLSIEDPLALESRHVTFLHLFQ